MKEQPECKIDQHRAKRWYLNDKLHREDGPAYEHPSGGKEWWLNGKRHREDGPAIEWADGEKHWWLNGKRHREDGPAIEYSKGGKEWWLHGRKTHPEALVDLHLSRGTFCYYGKQTDTLHFDEST